MTSQEAREHAMARVRNYLASDPEHRTWKEVPRWLGRDTGCAAAITFALFGFGKLEAQ